ncbi:MAG: hypothetical protein RLN60_02405 [Phycisphaerales bacterium]
MITSRIGTVCLLVASGALVSTLVLGPPLSGNTANAALNIQNEEPAMNVHFLEIVTPDMDKTCEALAKVHGVAFGDPVPEFGNARTAPLDGGGRISVRAPMHDLETPVVRPYVLVDDIEAAFKQATDAGGVALHPPLEIPGQGTFAIYELGGIQHGLWEN